MSVFTLFEVLGGLGLFFLGMKYMGEGLELAAGNKLRTLLEKITANKYLGMLVGLVVTAVIQSSSATAAMVVGFTNAGMMELAQTVGILFGSKIGTCMTSVLLSFDMDAIVPLFIFIGVIVMTFVKKNYQIKLDTKADLMGMGKSKKWILTGNYRDKSLLRNQIVLDLAQYMDMPYTPEHISAELYINHEYQGLYLFSEKVMIDESRIAITDLEKVTENLNDAPLSDYRLKGTTKS